MQSLDKGRGRPGETDTPAAAAETAAAPGEGRPRKLTPEMVREIRARAAEGISQRQLAKDYPVTQQALSKLLAGKTHRGVR